MKLIISHKGIKRELETPFALCCSADDLASLIRELKAVHAALVDMGSGYGWVRIDPSHPCDAPSNTKPLAWTDVRNINPPSDMNG
jgi:hypothetical protein